MRLFSVLQYLKYFVTMPMRMLRLNFYNKTTTRVPEKIFRGLLKQTEIFLIKEKVLNSSQRELLIELSLIGNKQMTTLNRHYHDKNRSTDVISLSYFSKKMTDPFIGEIFICLPYARKQARTIGQPLHEELRFLFVHGLLHLFGYDHKKPKEEAQMKKLTYKILGRR